MVHFGLKRHRNSFYKFSEILIRVFLLLLFVELERCQPFVRKIQPEELWLYRNPITDSYVPTNLLWTIVTFVPLSAIIINFLITKNTEDLTISSLVVTLGIPLNGVITDIIKLIVGRPRPDFAYRCWPESGGIAPVEAFMEGGEELHCTGNQALIMEGRKSFPSGHSSFSFCSLGFVFFYLSGDQGLSPSTASLVPSFFNEP